MNYALEAQVVIVQQFSRGQDVLCGRACHEVFSFHPQEQNFINAQSLRNSHLDFTTVSYRSEAGHLLSLSGIYEFATKD